MIAGGLDKDLERKQREKYSIEMEQQARDYITELTGCDLDGDLQECLKDGIILCKLINTIMPDRKPIKPSPSKLAFKQMENIGFFLQAVQELKVPSFETFQTVDLYEGKNIGQVVNCIFAVSRMALKAGFKGPYIGPKLSEKNNREFTEEQLLKAKAAVPLLSGFTGGASQKGYNMGLRRQIGGVYINTPDEESFNEQDSEALPSVVSNMTLEEGKVSPSEKAKNEILDQYF